MPNPPQKPRLSLTALVRQRGRARLFAAAGGRCFYCGVPVIEDGSDQDRDWLFVRPFAARMVREHVIPTVRGGPESPGNVVCSCSGCNRSKGAFTLEEFRVLTGLRAGGLNHRFAGEGPSPLKRDWLVCHSGEPFERDLVLHNQPTAAVGYEIRQRKLIRRRPAAA